MSHAFYLNCRKIADFLQSRGSGDDILAVHYAPGFACTLLVSEDWRVPINKQLAHVTYFRDDKTKVREIDRVACIALDGELKNTWRAFRKALREPYASGFVKESEAPVRNLIQLASCRSSGTTIWIDELAR